MSAQVNGMAEYVLNMMSGFRLIFRGIEIAAATLADFAGPLTNGTHG